MTGKAGQIAGKLAIMAFAAGVLVWLVQKRIALREWEMATPVRLLNPRSRSELRGSFVGIPWLSPSSIS